MTAIYLHGAAAQKFGGPFHLEIRSASEAIRALCKLVPGFMEHMKGHDWRIIRGTTKSAVREGRDTSKEELPIGLGRHQELHIIPVIGGAAGKSGIGKIVAGVVIIAVGVMTGGIGLGGAAAGFGAAAATGATVGISASSIAMFGASLLLGGISQMLAGNPKSAKVDTKEDSTQRSSEVPGFLFSKSVPRHEQPSHHSHGPGRRNPASRLSLVLVPGWLQIAAVR